MAVGCQFHLFIEHLALGSSLIIGQNAQLWNSEVYWRRPWQASRAVAHQRLLQRVRFGSIAAMEGEDGHVRFALIRGRNQATRL